MATRAQLTMHTAVMQNDEFWLYRIREDLRLKLFANDETMDSLYARLVRRRRSALPLRLETFNDVAKKRDPSRWVPQRILSRQVHASVKQALTCYFYFGYGYISLAIPLDSLH